jgi:hypothetical protein
MGKSAHADTALAAIVVAAILAAGCGPGSGLGSRRFGNRPPDPTVVAKAAELNERGDELAIEGASEDDLRQALASYEEAESLVGRTTESMIRRVRAIFLIAEPIEEKKPALKWANRGEDLAEAIVERAPERVEGYYYEALFIGLRARKKIRPKAIYLLPQMAERGRNAVEIDETFDDAGPLRLMGMLLVTAPAWPASVGDSEEGFELLRRAVAISDYPRNRLLLVEALMDDDDLEAGCTELMPLMNGKIDDRWAAAAARWAAEAKALASRGKCAPKTENGVVEAPHPGSM